ncbi:DUF6777 domain-containing protein [Streptomyces sp. NBC_00989]|uniref:DUF6777 domain-containing protein n=1 Tax=Streptomyces sp. NBC_00989 TaxID=2903705 RepID=UPI00386FE2A8|nr:hypothetical protein OG714_07390 [Streptomyces sp. NBC_00989]
MRTSTGTIATACALSATLLVAGCGGDGGKDTKSTGEVFLQPVAAQGPDPFTDSTATAPSAPPRVTRTPQSTPRKSPPPQVTPTGTVSTPSGPMRTVSGATPGLYGGTARTGSCDVERQISYLTRDQAKARAFARAEGISPGGIPGYLRGLTSVVLRADTQVTNHGFRDARVTGFQSVLQTGTAVLVDNRGVPRVRCACGNPLKAGVAGQGALGDSGRSWSGFRPAGVVVVTPAPQVITNITIINIVDNTWIERPLGHRGPHHDHVVPRPPHVTPTPTPSRTGPSPRPHDSGSSASPGGTSPSPSSSASTSQSQSPGESQGQSSSPGDGSASPGGSPTPSGSATDCVTPTVTVTPGATGVAPGTAPSPGATDCPAATVTATPTTSPPGTTLTPSQRGATPGAGTVVPAPSQGQDSPDEIGPPTVPETPDLPDGGGLIPDDTGTGSIFDSPTNMFDS